MASLADAVLPLIRTRADLHRLGAANAHGRQMHQGVDVLEAAIPGTDPSPVYTVTHKALASAVKVIARADDSSGVIGDACRRLLALHPQVAARAGVPAVRLADWMITFQVAWHELITSYEKIDPLAVLRSTPNSPRRTWSRPTPSASGRRPADWPRCARSPQAPAQPPTSTP